MRHFSRKGDIKYKQRKEFFFLFISIKIIRVKKVKITNRKIRSEELYSVIFSKEIFRESIWKNIGRDFLYYWNEVIFRSFANEKCFNPRRSVL